MGRACYKKIAMRIELIPQRTSQPIQLVGPTLYPSSLRTDALSMEWHVTVKSVRCALPLHHAIVNVSSAQGSMRASGPQSALWHNIVETQRNALPRDRY